MSSQKKRQNYQKQADAVFGRIIRAPGVCMACGSSRYIQCAHGFSRRYAPTRTDLRNAFPLCRGCHVYWTHRPLEWDEWLLDTWGEVLYDELRELALSGVRVDWKQRLAELRELERKAA